MDNWKKYVIDWKIGKVEEKIYEEKYKGIKLLQIVFPEFWQRAYETKNNFFQYILAEAKRHVELLGEYKEYLEEDRCRKFWQRHCNFCNKSITTDINEDCYCSKDGSDWICTECYNDFKEHFEWNVLKNAQDIPEEGFIALQIKIG